jgi:hypothetical protein
MPARSEPKSSPLHNTTAIELDHDVVVRFRVEAAKRERSVKQLIFELPNVIADDGLTHAILDDD